MSMKGWEAAIKYAYRIVKEDIGTGTGASQDLDLTYTATDELGVTTDDEGKVEVFEEDTGLLATSAYTLDGDGGADGVGQISGTFTNGKTLECSYYKYATVGYVQNVNLRHSGNITAVREIGNRQAVELKEGLIDITLSFERCFIDKHLVSTLTHEISSARGYLAGQEFDVELYPKGVGSGDPIMTIRGMFSDYGFDMGGPDEIIMETAEFVGKTVTVEAQ